MAAYYIGLMSGTSADAVDAALVSFEPGLEVRACLSYPLPPEMRRRLRDLDATSPVGAVAVLDIEFGELFAAAALSVLAKAGVCRHDVRAIGSHGQTVWHSPDSIPPYTLQIGDPNVIAARTGITTVADFRRRDVACGGQGAPLVPGFHASVLASDKETRVVLNLGGIANMTALEPGAPVRGFDTGPANTLLDAWSLACRGLSFDSAGTWAASARPNAELLGLLLEDRYFAMLPPKSTGPEHFNLAWLQRALDALKTQPAPAEVQATLAELTVRSVADAIAREAPAAQRVLVCGGGVHNAWLMHRLADRLQGRAVESTAEHGLDPDFVEASAFAWLARQCLAGHAANEPAVTGAGSRAVLGGIYPGGGWKPPGE
jgi:anhydro-N-acetylmuramic acid kinase